MVRRIACWYCALALLKFCIYLYLHMYLLLGYIGTLLEKYSNYLKLTISH